MQEKCKHICPICKLYSPTGMGHSHSFEELKRVQEKCKCYQLPYHNKFEADCNCKCHKVQEKVPEAVERFREKFTGIYYGKDIDNNPIYPPSQLLLDIEQFLLSELAVAEKQWCLKKPNINVAAVAGYEAGIETGRDQMKKEVRDKIKNIFMIYKDEIVDCKETNNPQCRVYVFRGIKDDILTLLKEIN